MVRRSRSRHTRLSLAIWFDRLILADDHVLSRPDGAFLTTSSYYRAAPSAGIAGIVKRPEFGIAVSLLLSAVTADLAHRLARIFGRSWRRSRKGDRDEAWSIAATDDTEWTAMYVTPV